jgi:RNA polymerase sigma-70 factor (ECF subfamily)
MSAPAAGFDYEAALLACARGERAALGWLYEHEAHWLMGVALRIVRRRELADEVLHDAFVQIWHKAASYDPTLGSARGWVYSVVRHRALDTLRRLGREGPLAETAPESRDEAPGPLDSLLLSKDASALHHCLQLLDEQKRACILLAYVDGYTQVQIASRLACPLGSVKAWVRRGLLALKECLS